MSEWTTIEITNRSLAEEGSRLLTIDGLSKNYGGKIAVDQLSFQVEQGQSYGLLGRNGAGKTTTIRIILDIIQAGAGRVLWHGKDIRQAKPRRGYLPEERGLYPKSTVYDQLMYFARLEGMPSSEADRSIRHWLERLNVSDTLRMKPEQLSKGNQQKIQIAASLVHHPELVILDEPFSGLDPVNANLLCDVIVDLQRAGTTLLFSSHQMGYVERFCKQITILKQGRSIVAGPIDAIKKQRDRHELLIELDRSEDALRLQQWAKAKQHSLRTTESGWLLQGGVNRNAKVQLLTAVAASGIAIRKLEWVLPSLHDIFVIEAGD